MVWLLTNWLFRENLNRDPKCVAKDSNDHKSAQFLCSLLPLHRAYVDSAVTILFAAAARGLYVEVCIVHFSEKDPR